MQPGLRDSVADCLRCPRRHLPGVVRHRHLLAEPQRGQRLALARRHRGDLAQQIAAIAAAIAVTVVRIQHGLEQIRAGRQRRKRTGEGNVVQIDLDTGTWLERGDLLRRHGHRRWAERADVYLFHLAGVAVLSVLGCGLGVLGQGGKDQQAPGHGLIARPVQRDTQQAMGRCRFGGVCGADAQQANGQTQAGRKTMQRHADPLERRWMRRAHTALRRL